MEKRLQTVYNNRMMSRKLVVRADLQIAELWEAGWRVASFPVSTAKNGMGCGEGSFCTPSGKFRIAQKIGEGLPQGAVLKSRQPTGEIWTGGLGEEDLILTRILWLEGAEDHNKNTKDRYIYLHGTNQEAQIGTPVSHGCVRFRNEDIVTVFDFLSEGAEVEIIYPSSLRTPIFKSSPDI